MRKARDMFMSGVVVLFGIFCLYSGGEVPILRAQSEMWKGSMADSAFAAPDREVASELLQRFKRYWDLYDTDGLLSLLSERGKVIMRVGYLNLDGEYGKSQAKYILKEFFEGGSKRHFTISRYRELSGGVSAYAAGTIDFVDEKFGLERKLKMFISLEERGGKWSVEEFRISDK